MGTEGAGPRELPAALLLFTWPDSAAHYQRWLHFSGKTNKQTGCTPSAWRHAAHLASPLALNVLALGRPVREQ